MKKLLFFICLILFPSCTSTNEPSTLQTSTDLLIENNWVKGRTEVDEITFYGELEFEEIKGVLENITNSDSFVAVYAFNSNGQGNVSFPDDSSFGIVGFKWLITTDDKLSIFESDLLTTAIHDYTVNDELFTMTSTHNYRYKGIIVRYISTTYFEEQ